MARGMVRRTDALRHRFGEIVIELDVADHHNREALEIYVRMLVNECGFRVGDYELLLDGEKVYEFHRDAGVDYQGNH